MAATEIEKAAATIRRWRHDPVAFVREALKDQPYDWQLEALADYRKHGRLAIRSGHGVGKSRYVAWIILHWLNTRFPTKVLVTGSNFDQLRATLWPEVGIVLRQMPVALFVEWEYTTESLRLKKAPEQSFAVLRTASKERAQGLAGFHSPNMLVVVDEASAVEDSIFEVISGALTNEGAKMVLTGNPTQASGYFYEAFNKNRELFCTRKVSCLDVPQVRPGYIEEQAVEYGRDSNVFRARVLGEFPTNDADGVIPLHLIEAAVGREVKTLDVAPIWGVDVARYGDDKSALAKRQGNALMEPVRTWQGIDTEQLAGQIHLEWLNTPRDLRPARIAIDVIGIGAGVVDKLKRELPIMPVNVAEAPATQGKYERLRDELWFRARDWFAARDCKIVQDDALIGELSGPKYEVRASGKLKVESKEELKRRGLRSPDIADSFVLTMAVRGTPSRESYGTFGSALVAQTDFNIWGR